MPVACPLLPGLLKGCTLAADWSTYLHLYQRIAHTSANYRIRSGTRAYTSTSAADRLPLNRGARGPHLLQPNNVRSLPRTLSTPYSGTRCVEREHIHQVSQNLQPGWQSRRGWRCLSLICELVAELCNEAAAAPPSAPCHPWTDLMAAFSHATAPAASPGRCVRCTLKYAASARTQKGRRIAFKPTAEPYGCIAIPCMTLHPCLCDVVALVFQV